MKFLLKSKGKKGLKGFGYSLISSMGIYFALASLSFSLPMSIAIVLILLTGNFL